jgi:prolyl oligopeptidase
MYPTTAQVDCIDIYHGIPVADPYRWLEEQDSDATRSWIEAQNQVTFQYLEGLPHREKLKQRLTQLWNYERYSAPVKQGDHYFYSKNDGLQNQSVIYTLKDLADEPQVLLDPNTLSEDGTIALSGISTSEDGRLMAYGLSHSGSDWQEWYVKQVTTGEDLSDHLKWIKFSSVSWTHDHRGFFYSRYDEPKAETQFAETNYFQKLYYHRLGTAQEEDTLIYHRPDQKEWGFSAQVSEDGDYLIISVWKGTDPRNLIFWKSLTDPEAPIVELVKEFEAEYSFIGNEGTLFWFTTDLNAPRSRVIGIDIEHPDLIQEIIPEAEETLQGVSLIHDQFVAFYLKDARTQIKFFALTGSFLQELSLPGIGSASGFAGKRTDTETFYTFTSFTVPPSIYRYDFLQGTSTLFRQASVDFDPMDYEVKQVFYHSKDGTRIPMFITHKKGILLHGQNPTYLYGYGGFAVSLTPSFSVSHLVWMEQGGVYAVPNLRGGGEYGESWHQAGTRLHKQTVFDDFIAAAEWLIANQYTSSDYLAIGGGSNGGLLVGACMTQRPELYAAALPAVGVMDMLRFHRFTIGWAWISEYGSSDNPEEFQALYAYSPLHQIKPGRSYPATLITTADHDDRVVPAHSFKFAATLQAAQAGDKPILIRIETKAGHGAGKPTAKLIEEQADRWAFLMATLGMGQNE